MILLHSVDYNGRTRELWMNPNHIVAFNEDDTSSAEQKKTLVDTSNGTAWVIKETPDEIMNLILKAPK